MPIPIQGEACPFFHDPAIALTFNLLEALRCRGPSETGALGAGTFGGSALVVT